MTKRKPQTKRKQTKRKRRRFRPFRLLFLLLFFWICAVGVKELFFNLFGEKQTTPITTQTYDPIYKHEYDWSNMITANGIHHYSDERYQSLTGIDVSYAQGDIDWTKVAADEIEFAIIRAGYRGYQTGELHEDSHFRANMNGARDAGLPVGVYFFSQAITEEEAREEAYFVLELIQGYEITCPIAYDMEKVTDDDRIKNLTVEERTRLAAAFCEVIKNAGYEPIIYGSDWWLRECLNMVDLQDDYEFWMASYNVARPAFPYVFTFWQYSENGHVDGIEKPVDLNVWMKPR